MQGYAAESQFHHWSEIVITTMLPLVVAALGRLIWSASKLSFEVSTIKTNHLPHLDADIKEVKGDVTEIRKAFIEHLQSNKG